MIWSRVGGKKRGGCGSVEKRASGMVWKREGRGWDGVEEGGAGMVWRKWSGQYNHICVFMV